MTDRMRRINRIHFVGIGGSGMSALAQVLAHRGQRVAGSDRSHDRGENAATFAQLAAQGITLYVQGVFGDAGAVSGKSMTNGVTLEVE